MPHAALWVVQPCMVGGTPSLRLIGQKFQCRTRLCGWCSHVLFTAKRTKRFQCRTRLCGWCSIHAENEAMKGGRFQCRTRLCGWCSCDRASSRCNHKLVSMPHAALWVVQLRAARKDNPVFSFQCRTRLCGWCSTPVKEPTFVLGLFQCRTRLCGWCNRASG